MRVAEYGPSRRADVAELMGRVWGARPAEEELEWFYERNPVRPASVLLAEDGGRTVGCVATSFQRMCVDGRELEVGTAVHLATDPAHRGGGVFTTLQTANEERVRGLGVPLLLTVPTPASARVLLGRLGWSRLPPLRVWARPRLARAAGGGPHRVERFGATTSPPVSPCYHGNMVKEAASVARDAAWLDWRFAEAPRPYTLLAGGGYAVVGTRGRLGVVAAVGGDLLREACAAARGPLVVAAPPPSERGRYARAGFVPTPRTFAVLGKQLDPAQPLPPRVHLELGDLDFL